MLFLSLVIPLSAEGKIHSFELEDIDGNATTLAEYAGKVLLVVNVASKCGFTYQYEALEAVHGKYNDQGLVVLGFPSNDFLGQEPANNEEIKEFCSLNYGVTFPMFSKTTVKGRKMHPLYKHLTSKETNPDFGGRITWNFNKFLIGSNGEIINRFDSKTEPDSPEVITAIEQALEGGKNEG